MAPIESHGNNKLVEKFIHFLNEHHCRQTPERLAVLHKALEHNKHFSIDELCVELNDGNLHVSRATVYNTIELLCEAQILRRIHVDMRRVRYERLENTNYIHLVCTQCGKIKEVRDVNLNARMNARSFTAFNSSYFTLCVYGICSTCARKMKRPTKRQNPN